MLPQMNAHLFFSPFLHFIILALIVLLLVSTSYCKDHEQFTECNRPYQCGIFPNLSYPFWGTNRPFYCGQQEYNLTCEEHQYPVLQIYAQKFQILQVKQSPPRMTITRMDTGQDNCPEGSNLDPDHFRYTNSVINFTFFHDCRTRRLIDHLHKVQCIREGRKTNVFYEDGDFLRRNQILYEECEDTKVPVQREALDECLRDPNILLNETINKGFEVQYFAWDSYCTQCKDSGGKCGSNSTSSQEFVCLCPDQPHPLTCPKRAGGINRRVKILTGVGTGLVGTLATSIAFYLYRSGKKKENVPPFPLSRNISSDLPSVADFGKGTNCYGVHLFTYAELVEATSNFDSARELGDGGFGTVYYGKLRDGRAVAVKRLFENSCKRVEQFMNEVEILTRLRHQHLVSLCGSTSRHSRELLLVYEYVPKGTVADHLHGEHAKPGALPWPIRLKIATETASALTYLHATDIIHRDVKTNNILLDNNFSVKVADFGLFRLFPTDVTHVSTAPQGTPGYVDPEYHQCYQLTDKSDVFSFGVVLIELISSKPAVDITRHRHEINLSNMAINKIQNHALHELVDPSLGFESDSKVREMITAVAELAFQCLQNEKDMRPNMIEVLQCLTCIQSEGYNTENAEEMDMPSDDVVLLKSGPLPVSPDTVTVKWVSRSTISDASN